PNSPANADTNSTAILDVIRSARNPVTNVFTNTSAEGISTAMTSGSRKTRSTCWMTKNSSHQNTIPCLNDHSNICFPFNVSRPSHAGACGLSHPCDWSCTSCHASPCLLRAMTYAYVVSVGADLRMDDNRRLMTSGDRERGSGTPLPFDPTSYRS